MPLKTNDEIAKARRAERRKLRRAKRKAESAGLDPSEVVASTYKPKSSAPLPEKNQFRDEVLAILRERFPDTEALKAGEDYWYSFSTDLCRDHTPEDAVDAMLTRLLEVKVEPTNWVHLGGPVIGFGPSIKSTN